jgi:putative ABC transport system permease protein
MLRSFVTITARIFQKEPWSLLLTVLGLALGLAVAFILSQHAVHELDSDSFRKDANRIFRAGLVMRWADDQLTWEETRLGINTPGLVKQISERYPEIEDFTRILHQSNFNYELIPDHGKQIIISANNQSSVETSVVYADSNVFSFFGISLVAGDPVAALHDSNNVVLSESKARKYFGTTQVTGMTLLLNDTIPLRVSGVFEDLPQNTHLDFDFVISSKRVRLIYDDKLEVSVGGPHAYFKLRDTVDATAFAERVNRECGALLGSAMYNNKFRTLSLYLQPLLDVPFSVNHLDTHHPESRYFLHVLRYAALAIILVGVINYINLMIAMTGFRLKELAVRKTAGASFWHFLWQFTFDALLVHLIALGFTLIILLVIKTPARLLLNFYVPGLTEIRAHVWITILMILVFSIFFSGFYPAHVFFKRGINRLFRFARVYTSENLPFRVLGIFQYSSALVMLIVAFAITHQLYFINGRGLGIRSNDAVVIDLSLVNASPQKIATLVSTLQEKQIIEGYALSSSVPGDNSQSIIGLKKERGHPTNFIETNGSVDRNFIPFFGLTLIAGENFRAGSDGQVILTEGAMQRLGFLSPGEAVGRQVFLEDGSPVTIVGIVNDYRLRLLLKTNDFLFYEGNTGVVLTYNGGEGKTNNPAKLTVRLQKRTGASEDLRKTYGDIFPASTFIAYDHDSFINRQYHSYVTARNQLIFFVLITLVIAIIGLYAFASRKIAAKTKEIGVRKVLGASIPEISLFLLKAPMHQMIVSAIISVPTAYFIIVQYFKDFDEHVSLSWHHVIIPVAVFLLIAIIPIAPMVVRVSKENPTESIRHE